VFFFFSLSPLPQEIELLKKIFDPFGQISSLLSPRIPTTKAFPLSKKIVRK